MGRPTLASVFSSIDTVEAAMAERRSHEEVQQALRLVKAVTARLPLKYLPAATFSELRAVEKLLRREGLARRQRRLLRRTLIALYDRLVLDGALRWHPLRGEDKKKPNPVTLPSAGLAIALAPEVAKTVVATITSMGLSLHTEHGAEATLQRCEWFPFRFVLLGFPLPTPTLFLDTLRGPTSLCRTTGVVLLCDDAHVKQASIHLGRGANRVISLSRIQELLCETITVLDQVSERVRLKIPVRIEQRHRVIEGPRCENISRTGMLLRTSIALHPGAVVDLVFKPPRNTRPIRASAKVVRTTTFGREEFTGYGLSFLGFHGDGQYRLERVLR